MNNTLTLKLPFSIIRYLYSKMISVLKFTWFLLVPLTLALLALYVIQTNAMILEGYQIQGYQKKLNDLYLQNEVLKIKLTQTNYLRNIEEKVQELGFERIGQIHYIQLIEDQVATK